MDFITIAQSENGSFILLVALGAGAIAYMNRMNLQQAKDLKAEREEDKKLMERLWKHLDKAQAINAEHADLLRELKEEIKDIRGDIDNIRRVEFERLWVEVRKRRKKEKDAV